jgi:hypothetical protein
LLAGVLFSNPKTPVAEPSVNASSSTGKFWPLLPPPSGSSRSFAVEPTAFRSMPSPPLLWMLLRVIMSPTPVAGAIWAFTCTPASELKAITFSETTQRVREVFENQMPLPPLGSGLPSTAMPITLPSMTF